MGISVSSTVNLANTKQRMSLGGRELDWSLVPSAGKNSKSKAEFADEIKELARRASPFLRLTWCVYLFLI